MLDTFSIIEKCLYEKDDIFVFPSDLAARNCAEHIARKSLQPISLERFIAWDRFKEETLSGDKKESLPANSLIRRLFSSSLMEENAKSAIEGRALFHDLIPPRWALNYTSFIESTARILPILGPIQTELDTMKETVPYFADLMYLASRWEAFMKDKGLFEPGWQRNSLDTRGKRWVLLYPDLVEDWTDYEDELRTSPSIDIYTLDSIPKARTQSKAVFIPFASVQEELRNIVRMIRHDIDVKGVDPAEIVLSVPQLDLLQERIEAEFRLFDLQATFHVGQALSDWPFGKLLIQLRDCAAGHWSFNSLKTLLLDPRIPWKNSSLIYTFLEFGRKFRCVSGYEIDEKAIDVWEDSFKRLAPSSPAYSFWRKLKFDINAILTSKDFNELRENVLKFKTNQLDEDRSDHNDDKVISRILRELQDLRDTSERLSPIEIPNPFSLFLTHLRSASYVQQHEKGMNIQVYPYRVGAGINAARHYIPNASQEALSIRPAGHSLLPEPLRALLPIEHRNLPELFIRAYRHSGQSVVFTMAQQSTSGFAIPHIGLSDPILDIETLDETDDLIPDPWEEERRRLEPLENRRDGGALYPRSSLQDTAYKHWTDISSPEHEHADFRYQAVAPSRIWDTVYPRLVHDANKPRLSPSDLLGPAHCPFSWLLSQGIGLKELITDPETVEQREVGLLYHKILEGVFHYMEQNTTRIRNTERPLWDELIKKETTKAIQDLEKIEGSFQDSIYEILSARVENSVRAFIDLFLPQVEEASIFGVEIGLSGMAQSTITQLSGKADLVLLCKDGTLLLVDFKTNTIPTPSDLLLGKGERFVGNYQLAAYTFMLEQGDQNRVERAWFYSFDKRQFVKLIDPSGPSRSNSKIPVIRDDYQKELDSLICFIEHVQVMLDSASFPILNPADRKNCRSCPVRSACRIPYTGED